MGGRPAGSRASATDHGLLATLIRDWPAWLLTGIVSTGIYLSVAALEVAVARALHLNLGDRDPQER